MLADSQFLPNRVGRSLVLLVLAISVAAGGCCFCDNQFDEQYAAYGGRNPRVDMVSGRVGSAFHDASGIGFEEPFGPGLSEAEPSGEAYEMGAPYSQEEPFQLQGPKPYGEPQYGQPPLEEIPFEPTAPNRSQPSETGEPELAEPSVEPALPEQTPFETELPDLKMDEAPMVPPLEQPTPAEPTPLEPQMPAPPKEDEQPPQEPSPSDLDFGMYIPGLN